MLLQNNNSYVFNMIWWILCVATICYFQPFLKINTYNNRTRISFSFCLIFFNTVKNPIFYSSHDYYNSQNSNKIDKGETKLIFNIWVFDCLYADAVLLVSQAISWAVNYWATEQLLFALNVRLVRFKYFWASNFHLTQMESRIHLKFQ